MNGRALTYLNLTRLKNRIKALVQKPVQLIYILVLLLLLGMTVFGGNASVAAPGHVFRDIRELIAIAALLYTVMFILTARNGFDRGGSLFTMPDVNLLFAAPVSSRRILFYGLFRQMTASLLLGFFLLFQYTILHSTYGISYGALLLLVLGYAVTVFLGQVTAVLLYSFTNQSDARKRVCKAACLAVLLMIVAVLAWRVWPGDRAGLLARAADEVSGLGVKIIPVAGWAALAVGGVLAGSAADILLGTGFCFAWLAAVVALIFVNDADYYEDVLGSAENAQSAITAQKEGTMKEATPRHVRVGKTGLGGGWGASVFFNKHRLENRRSRSFILSGTSFLFAIIVIVFTFFFRNQGGVIAVFAMATYMQIFTVMMGRMNRELLKPYVYLVPEPAIKRMLWCLAELLPSALTESVVLMVPVGLILGLGPVDITLSIVARLSYALLFTAANVVEERIWGGVTSRMLLTFLYFVIALILAVPGIVLTIIFGTGTTAMAFAMLVAGNLPAALLALFLCRNMLEYAELNYT